MDSHRVKQSGQQVADALRRHFDTLAAEVADALQARDEKVAAALKVNRDLVETRLQEVEEQLTQKFEARAKAACDEVRRLADERVEADETARKALRLKMEAHVSKRLSVHGDEMGDRIAAAVGDTQALLRAEFRESRKG